MKESIAEIFKHRNTPTVVLVLLVTSVVANVYFLAQTAVAPTVFSAIATTATTSATVLESPYGFRNEVVTIYEGKQAKTYSTTTPITEADVKEMRDNIIRHQKMMGDYFRKHEELFRSFWHAF